MDFIPIACPYIGEEDAQAVYEVVKSGWISMGKKVRELEDFVCDYIGVKHAVTFNNGTSSLHAALLAVGVESGDEVLVPTLSYISSANTILFCGATPVFCDAEPKTFNVTAVELQRRATSKTKAVMTVDLKGLPADYDSIMEFSQNNNIPIVSDSAESFGAVYKQKRVGGQCPIHSFSFFANKNITMGEGGMITTNDDELADKCRVVRNQGQSERYVHVVVGNNYRPTDYAAALGLEQVKRIEWIMEEKQKIAEYYNKAFKNHPLIEIPYVPEYATRHSWYMYCLTLAESIDRDKVVNILKENGVDSRLSFPPIHLQPIYREMFGYKEGDFELSEKIFSRFIDIPCWVNMGKARMERVIEYVFDAVEKAN